MHRFACGFAGDLSAVEQDGGAELAPHGSEKPAPDHQGGDAAVFERGAAIGGRDVLNLLDGRAASLLLERLEKPAQTGSAFPRSPRRIGAGLRFI